MVVFNASAIARRAITHSGRPSAIFNSLSFSSYASALSTLPRKGRSRMSSAIRCQRFARLSTPRSTIAILWRPELTERKARTILLNGVGWTARKLRPQEKCFFLDSLMELVGTDPHIPIWILGSEEARSRAGLRPPPKLPVPISGRQLSRRLSKAERQEKELSRSDEQARTRRKAGP